MTDDPLDELRKRLTPEQFAVTQRCATEPPFSGALWNEKRTGRYTCVVCGTELFGSNAKFDSGTGWPSFFAAAGPGRIAEREDLSHGMRRTEILCAACGAHLGHVFPDGPAPTGLRYCVNSAALRFVAED
jgi:peptide-methionine (R)-S-oxide reductase